MGSSGAAGSLAQSPAAGPVRRAARAALPAVAPLGRVLAGTAGLAAVAVALSAVALANGFPLVYSDTGTYLESARVLVPNPDRPLVYGLLVRAVTLGRAPMLAVLAQALVLGSLVVAAFRHAAGLRRPHAPALVTAVALVGITGVGVIVGHLLPDALAAAAILALALLLSTPLPPLSTAGAALAVATGVATHLSVLPLGVLLAAGALVAEPLRGHPARWARLHRLGIALASLASGALALVAVNAHLGAGRTLSAGSPVFLVGRMAQTGLLDEVLAARCPDAGWRLCALRGRIPRSIERFVWPPGAPLQVIGGFGPDAIAECRAVLRASLGEPRWIVRHVVDAARGTAEQLVRMDLGWVDGPEQLAGWGRPLLGRSFPGALAAHDRSAQGRGALALGPLERAQPWAVAAGLVALAVLLIRLRGRRELAGARAFAVFLVGGVIANAAASGALSSPNGRYGARAAFLVPLAAAVLAAAAQRGAGLRKRRYASS